jgi:hypothetical protein
MRSSVEPSQQMHSSQPGYTWCTTESSVRSSSSRCGPRSGIRILIRGLSLNFDTSSRRRARSLALRRLFLTSVGY